MPAYGDPVLTVERLVLMTTTEGVVGSSVYRALPLPEASVSLLYHFSGSAVWWRAHTFCGSLVLLVLVFVLVGRGCCFGCWRVCRMGYSGCVHRYPVVGMLISFFTVEPLRLLPMVVMGFWRGFVVSSFGGGLVASARGGLVPTTLWVA